MGAVKRIALLGSTGSIGTQTLDVIRDHPDRLQVVALAASTSGDAMLAQAAEFGVTDLALFDEKAAAHHGVPGGIESILAQVTRPDVDIVVVSVAGVVGLLPTLEAIKAGKQVALASKEVLVAAGEIVMPLCKEHGVLMTPIDSEHSAVFQCVQGIPDGGIESITLTASGGPFRGQTRAQLEKISPREALAHPTWNMGGKITVDSATLMNKGLEVIEAKWLFGLSIDQVKVVVHPQSIIHSAVKTKDGSVLAQMGWPSMKLPIQYALLYPERVPNSFKPWELWDTPSLTFEPPDIETFKSLRLARESVQAGGTMPCVLNAANEHAANAFLRDECGFLQIADVVEEVMSRHTPVTPTLEAILELDQWARQTTANLLGVPAPI